MIRTRFIEKIHRPDNVRDCWEWSAAKNCGGYGVFWRNGRMELAHRVSWEIHIGPIPDGMCACHNCDNPCCVNPNHLFLGTKADNNSDKDAKGRRRDAVGDNNGQSKLKNPEAIDIYNSRESTALLSEKYGISEVSVRNIRSGRLWSRITEAVA